MDIPNPKFAPLPHWCAISGMSRTATYNALGRGDLKAIKVGTRTLLDVEAGTLMDALAALGANPRTQGRLTRNRPSAAAPGRQIV